jgi:hypothetical protein
MRLAASSEVVRYVLSTFDASQDDAAACQDCARLNCECLAQLRLSLAANSPGRSSCLLWNGYRGF